MMNSVLSNHSRILGLHELHFIDRFWRHDKCQRWSRRKADAESARLVATARRSIWNSRPTTADKAFAKSALSGIDAHRADPSAIYQAVLTIMIEEAEKVMVTDQTPRNVYYAQSLLERFPLAKMIHMIRDPRAVLLSQKNRWRQRRLGATKIPMWNAIRVFINYHPITASRLWLKALEAAERVDGHPRFMKINFEEFVAEPGESTARICTWLGLDYEETMLDVPKIGSSNVPHDESNVGISTEVVDKWRSQLSKAEIWFCQRKIGPQLEKQRYDRVNVGNPVLGICWQLLIYPLHIIGVLLTNPLVAWHVLRSVASGDRKGT